MSKLWKKFFYWRIPFSEHARLWNQESQDWIRNGCGEPLEFEDLGKAQAVAKIYGSEIQAVVFG